MMERLKRFTFISWLSVTAVTAAAQSFAAGSAGGDAVAATLRYRLDSLLRDPLLETTQLGLMVYDLTADSTVYERNARQLMRPASTMKLLTAVTALDQLGGDYRLKTRLYYTGEIADGKLVGDVYCVGGFDPMVDEVDIMAFAQSLHRLGVDTLRGTVYADQSMKEALDYGEGWCWDDDNPRLRALSVGRKDVFAERLLQAMARDSMVCEDVRVGEGRCPETAALVSVRSHGIDELLLRMMKRSDNFYAEALFYQIAKAVSERRPARAADGRAAVRRLIRRLGLEDGSYRIADGSGLSLYNYVSAELEVRLLRYAWRDGRIYGHLLPSLPVAGVDGTLEKRMRRTAAAGNVRAKTGTLTGVSSLAGYCRAANGHELAFCIINQGVLRGQAGRAFQDGVCRVLCEPWGVLE